MQDRLAMKADHADFAGPHPICREERLDGLRMGHGHERFSLAKRLWPFAAVADLRSDGDCTAQQAALLLGIGAIAGRPEAGYPLAIGIDERHVDAIAGRAAHQSDGR